MQARTDKELIEAYADSGDESAFAELVSRYQPLVYRTCFRLLRDAHEAEDAAQAAFVVLARKAGKLRQEGKLNGWLHRVARNVGLYALERRADRERQKHRIALWQENVVGQDGDDADTEAVLRQVDEELDGLSAVLREAVILRHLRGHSEKDAAELAGCPVSAMKWRTSDGLAKLRSRLAKRGIAVGLTALVAALESEAQATIPETLLSSTVTAVKAYATTGAATTAVSANVVVLTKGVLNMMFWNGVKIGVAAAMGIVAVTSAGVVAHLAMAKENANPLVSANPPSAEAVVHWLVNPSFTLPAAVRRLHASPDGRSLAVVAGTELYVTS